MIKKIKEYFEIRKLYRDSKKVLIINGASSIIMLNEIIEKINNFIETQNDVVNVSKEDISTMTKFMNEMLSNKNMQKNVAEEVAKRIHKDK